MQSIIAAAVILRRTGRMDSPPGGTPPSVSPLLSLAMCHAALRSGCGPASLPAPARACWRRPRHPPRPRRCASARPGARRSRSCRSTSACAPASSSGTASTSRSRASAATPACSRRWRRTASTSALGSGPGLAFIVKGSPVKGIAAMAGPPLLFALVVRNDDSVKTPDDLKGRKVGVSTVGSVTSWIVSEVARQKGWGFSGHRPGADRRGRGADRRPQDAGDRRRHRQSGGRAQLRPAAATARSCCASATW